MYLYLNARTNCKLHVWTRRAVCRPNTWTERHVLCGLTYNVERDEVTHLGFGADLTLVLARIARLHVFDLQCPRVGGFHEEGLETLVGDERIAVHGEDVRVAPSDPRHLQQDR